ITYHQDRALSSTSDLMPSYYGVKADDPNVTEGMSTLSHYFDGFIYFQNLMITADQQNVAPLYHAKCTDPNMYGCLMFGQMPGFTSWAGRNYKLQQGSTYYHTCTHAKQHDLGVSDFDQIVLANNSKDPCPAESGMACMNF